MKAKEAPEKLYGCYKGHGNLFVDYRPFPNDESIEYTRTDAFIDKAVLWMKRKSAIRYHLSEELIEQFKKAMTL